MDKASESWNTLHKLCPGLQSDAKSQSLSADFGQPELTDFTENQ